MNNSPQKSQQQQNQRKLHVDVNNKQSKQQQQNQQNEDNEGKIFQHEEPQEKMVSLMRGKDQQGNQQKMKEQLIGKLKGILHQKVENVKVLRKSIANCKKQIKEIGEQVDKQMNKSIVKHSKSHNTVNIRTIFHNPKTQDPQTSKLQSQIDKIRTQSKKLKSQITNLQQKLSNPINTITQQRINQTKTRIKQVDTQLKHLEQQKQYLQKDIKMLIQEDSQQLDYQDQEYKINREKNMELLNQLKEEKNALYDLEKEDRIITEKIRYLDQMDSQIQNRMRYGRSKEQNYQHLPKEELETQIKQIIGEINQILEKRNKVENQRKNHLKNLTLQVSSLQAKNWQSVNKLRQIDSYLIRHYSKNHKKIRTRQQRPSQDISKHSATIMVKSTKPKTPTINDKNMTFHSQIPPQPIQLVQKKKTYDFMMSSMHADYGDKTNKDGIIMTDQMLGTKVRIKSMNFVFDQEFMYGIWADYQSCENAYPLTGYKIMPKIRPKECNTKTLNLNKQLLQLINFVHIGSNQDGNVKYLHIITSEGNSFKWGTLDNCVKNQQKNIRKYQSIVMKGKLIQLMDREAPNYYCLGGIGFVIVYIGPK